ncbi:hypothetical protein ACFFIX_25015 [Metabacillus herbersteinensis]|uniref:Carotenoid biosynthesis protein n=1 Tax=Metabacillus herbersteinensis TaxID=283816 RepID=A0ABV6GLM1_9BACI
MLSKRHLAFNIAMIVFPWLSVLFLGKRNIKRFFPAALITIIFEMMNAKVGQKRKWWVFYDNRKSFISNELPFSVGPFIPGSMWILKFTYGNLKNFLLLNAAVDGFFAFILTKFLEKVKIARLGRLNEFQFFIYLFYKVVLLYSAQYFVENKRNFTNANPEINYYD